MLRLTWVSRNTLHSEWLELEKEGLVFARGWILHDI